MIKIQTAKRAIKAEFQDETDVIRSELRAAQRMSSTAAPGPKP